jgi:hypothetical protein
MKTSDGKVRLLLLSDGQRKSTRDVLSGCSLPEELELPPPAPAPGIWDRGVYRDGFAPALWAEYSIIDSLGVLRRRIGMPLADVTEYTVPELWRLLDELDPPGPRRVYDYPSADPESDEDGEQVQS